MSCNKEMIKMIDLLNKLQDKLVSLGVTDLVKQLPQIAVIGSQSAGKSSVLESFVGRDFLPRGGDIVTRRPLILQLKQNRDDSRVYAKFNHSPKIFTEFDEIRLEIETETDRTVPDSAISSDPINLMITSPDVLDLNLVDLPGMTKVPVGNQPDDIEDIVKNLIHEYISKDNCLILAVTPANQDLSTSDAIKLAREVDPEGRRTIGVLTKMDTMDKGMNARAILTNQHKIRLRRGFIGVINRSQKDIDNKKSLKDAIADERTFFANHKAYKDIKHKLGIEYLQKYLQEELANHLFVELPTLCDKFEDELINLNERLRIIGKEINEMNANDLISFTLESLRQNFHNEIGTGDDVPVDRTNGGAKINIKMNVDFPEAIASIVRNERRIKKEIGLAIMNIFGTRLELFVPNKAFTTVIRQQIELMRTPAIKCVDNVFGELETIVKNSAKGNGIARFPKLIDMYTHFTLENLRECKKRAKEFVEHRIETEKAYINTNNEEFLRSIEPESTNSELPLTKLMVNQSAQDPIKTGTVKVNGTSYFVSLEDHWLHWFPDRFRTQTIGSFDLSGAQTICGQRYLLLKKISNFNQLEYKLEFESKESLLEWVTIILDKTGDINEADIGDSASQNGSAVMDNNSSETGYDSDTESVKYPIKMEAQVDQVLNLVIAYIKLIEKTLKDTLPKLCQKELIDATEKFIAIRLRGRVQDKDMTIDKLVDVDPMEEERKNIVYLQSLYEEALQTMNDVLKPSNT